MKCRSCHSPQLVDVLSLGNQYLSDFIEIADNQKPPAYPLNMVMCKDCTLVQLQETTPASALYTERYGYKSGINQTMREHLAGIAVGAMKRCSVNYGDIVVDIGANDGTLLKNYPNYVWRVGYEPIRKLAEECAMHANVVFNHFFEAESFIRAAKTKKAKIITAISMFYDLDDPNAFVADVAKILDPTGIFIIQQNYLAGMLRQHAFDNIVHEHLEYYSLNSLEKLLNRHFLEVVEVEENDLNGGSFRTYIRHMDSVKKMRFQERQMRLDKWNPYFMFGLQVRSLKQKLHKFIASEVKKGKRVYAYGASTRGNTLLQYCGLDSSLIQKAVERNSEKWGKKIASLGIPIISEAQARAEKPDYMLVLPWFFRKEIVDRETDYLKGGGALVFPLPKFEVVTNEN